MRVPNLVPIGPQAATCIRPEGYTDTHTLSYIDIEYVEFTQGKLRIVRATTVNDYLCCKGGKCLGLSFTHSSLTNDSVICRTMRRQECKLFSTSVTCRLSPNQWIIGPTSHDAYF